MLFLTFGGQLHHTIVQQRRKYDLNPSGRMGASQFCKKLFFIIVRASPLAYSTTRERGRSHYKCKTEMLPEGFARGNEFLHIVVIDAPDQEVLT